MAFGGGGFFGSGADQSETDASQTTAGAQSQTGGAASLNINPKKIGKNASVSTTLNVSTTDYGALDAAQKLNQGALDLGMTATEEAIAAANNFGVLSFGALTQNTAANNEFASNIFGKSTEFAGDSLTAAIGSIEKQTEYTLKQNTDTIDRAFNLSMLNSRSEGEAVTTEGIKALTIVAGIVAAGFALAQLAKSEKPE